MAAITHITTWADFLRLPERPPQGQRYGLHDGEGGIVPPASPHHIKLQKHIERLLESLAGNAGVVTIEFPYRPAADSQFWFADVAYIPQTDWDALPPDRYPVYAPPLIVEVLSPSNTQAKVARQRDIAMAAGTLEFWVVDASARTIRVSTADGTLSHAEASSISLTAMRGTIDAAQVFAV